MLYFKKIKNLTGTSFGAFEIFPKIWDWRLKDHDDFRHFYVTCNWSR